MNTMQSTLSFHLFARPSFWEGAARVLDLGATLQSYNEQYTPSEADTAAMLSDWVTTGEDLRSAISTYERQQPAAA